MTEAQIKHMAERFLAWKLPEDFNPDGGVSFEPSSPPWTLSGTNLLTYTQAAAMVRHMAAGLENRKDQCEGMLMTDTGVSEELRRIAYKAAAPFLPGGTICFNAIDAALSAIAPRLIAQGLREAARCQPCTAENPNENAYQRGRFDGIIDFGEAILARADALSPETKP